jgi:TolB protein
VFTPDGSAIIFSVTRGGNCFLYRGDAVSGAMRRVTRANTGCESDPAFSPDGSKLAFMVAPRAGARAALMVANADGNAARALVPGDEDNLQPVFVPHSNQILFLRSGAFEHYSPLVDNMRHKFDVFAADLDSGSVTALTNKKFYEISHLSVSPDGKRAIITVSTYPEGDQFLVLPVGRSQGTPQTLQPSVIGGPSSSPVIYNAVWMPDGKSLLFSAAAVPAGGGNFNYNVYRLTIASGAVEQLTQLTGLIGGFSVSPDGKRAVVLYGGEYLILDLSTHQLTKVPLQWAE